MSSIIEGYNYDIFISYRQKDNKGDRWVSKFVESLKTELEATFKEDVSVYFDENPHDRLQETHNVDKSLEGKLKCLIFIPILSQTYCDPNSYAWQYEFLAFLRMAEQDRFGKDIKLRSGNVASRILPIRIHDLEQEDIKLFEKETGSVLRAMDFVFKTSSGVNRPLKVNEDHPQDNLNKTFYSDQINKVGHVIKEIIQGMKVESDIKVKEKPHLKESTDDDKNEDIRKAVISKGMISQRSKKWLITTLSFVVVLAGIFAVFKFIGRNKKNDDIARLEKSIAVLPFKSLSTDPDKQYLADGMMDAITLHLSKIKELRVLGRTSTEQYRKPTKTLTRIGNELGVNYLLEGSFQKSGDEARLIVQLIRTGKEGHVWANEYDRNWNDIFNVESEVSQKIAEELNAAITPEEKQLIEKIPTTNLTAYDFYQRGREEFWRQNLEKSEELFHKALEYDPKFAQAYSGLAMVYQSKYLYQNIFSSDYLDSVLVLTNIALSYNAHLSEAYLARGLYYNAVQKKDQAIEELEKAKKYDPNDWRIYWNEGWVLLNLDFVKTLENHLKAASFNHSSQLPAILRRIGNDFLIGGFLEKARQYHQDALILDGDSSEYYNYLATNEFCSGNLKEMAVLHEKAAVLQEKNFLKDKNNGSIYYDLGNSFMFSHQSEKAISYFEKYLQKKGNELTELDFFGFHRIAWAYHQKGDIEKSKYYINKCIENCEKAKKLGRGELQRLDYDLAAAYAFKGDRKRAYENLIEFSRINIFSLWWLAYLKYDPLYDNIRNESEFQKILSEFESTYQTEHERVKKWLEEQVKL